MRDRLHYALLRRLGAGCGVRPARRRPGQLFKSDALSVTFHISCEFQFQEENCKVGFIGEIINANAHRFSASPKICEIS